MRTKLDTSPSVWKMGLLCLCAAFVFSMLCSAFSEVHALGMATGLRDYYVEHFVAQTGATNAVAAIYLDYRIFDTAFEAAILLMAVAGVLFVAGEKKDRQKGAGHE